MCIDAEVVVDSPFVCIAIRVDLVRLVGFGEGRAGDYWRCVDVDDGRFGTEREAPR